MSKHDFSKDADKLEAIVDKALDAIGNDEPIRSPLLNIRGEISHLRDAIAFAEGQVR